MPDVEKKTDESLDKEQTETSSSEGEKTKTDLKKRGFFGTLYDYAASFWAGIKAVSQNEEVGTFGTLYGFGATLASGVKSIFALLGKPIGLVTAIPIVQTVINGFYAILDLVEAIFLSKETRATKAIKGINAVTSTGLGIASLVLSLNPATAPIGATLSLIAASISVVNSAYEYYAANVKLTEAEEVLKKAETEHAKPEQIAIYKKDVEKCNLEVQNKFNNLLMNSLSLICGICLVLAGVAVATGLFSPIGIGILGAVLLVGLTFKAYYDKYHTESPKKPEAPRPAAANDQKYEDRGNVKEIGAQLTPNKEAEVKLLQESIAKPVASTAKPVKVIDKPGLTLAAEVTKSLHNNKSSVAPKPEETKKPSQDATFTAKKSSKDNS